MRKKTPGINRFTQLVRSFKVARLLLWTIWVIYRERRRVVRAHERGKFEVQPDVDVLIDVLVEFRKTAVKLGVLMIKLGQFLSARADLLPEQALAVLVSLQDEVPPESFDHVVEVIESELAQPVDKIFSLLERKCTAAASLGQVHKAVLAKTGETVAVKIQRPNIEQLVHMDLSTLKFVIWVITKLVRPGDFIDLWGVYREFRRTVYEEIDYVTETTNAQRFREMFQHDPTVYIPRVYEQYVTHRMIVLEWVDGIKINDYAQLDAFEIDRMEVAKRTVNAYFHQFFEAGFFHADPHPGNIFVRRGSPPDRPVIAFVDFGMVGSVTKPMKRSLRELFLSVVTRDTHTLVDALVNLGLIGAGANLLAVERAMEKMLEQYHGMTLGQFRDIEMQDVARDIVELLYDQPFHVPAHFAFAGRAVSTLVGVATGLAPDFNFVEVATPYARHFLGLDVEGAGETLQEIGRQLLDTSRVLLTLPRTIQRLVTRIEAGQVEVRLANLPLGKGSRRSMQLAGAVARQGGAFHFLTFASSLGGGIYLTSIHQSAPGWFCLALSGIIALLALLRR